MALGTPVGKAVLYGTKTKTRNDGTIQTDAMAESDGRNVYVPSDADILYHQKHSILTTADLSLDLSGSLEDALGDAAVYAKVYGFMVSNLNVTAGNFIWVGASNWSTWLGDASDKIKVGPKGVIYLMSPVDGYTVTATSADIFKINNPALVTVDVLVSILGKA